MYEMTLFDLHLAINSLQWRNIELLQAIRLNTLLTVSPFTKREIQLDDLYQLPTDYEVIASNLGNIQTREERARQRVLEFNKSKGEKPIKKEEADGI